MGKVAGVDLTDVAVKLGARSSHVASLTVKNT